MRCRKWTPTTLLLLLTLTTATLTEARRKEQLTKPPTKRQSSNNSTKFPINNASNRKESNDWKNSSLSITTNTEKNESLLQNNNKFNYGGSIISPATITTKSSNNNNNKFISESSDDDSKLEKREFVDAIEYGLKTMQELIDVKEPKWYRMGLYLDDDHPGKRVATFGAPSKKAMQLSNFGFAAIVASKKIAESHPEDISRQSAGIPFETRLLQRECPLRGVPKCLSAAKRYRTADGTCNNIRRPWRGSSLLPMRRFLPPVYEDGLEEARRSILGQRLPSAREISSEVHRDKDIEVGTVNLMFMQWGQFVDHDLTSTVKARSFNGSVPRCCHRGGAALLPEDLTHPNCMPIEVPPNDWFLSRFGIRCIEFIRSAPATQFNCNLGWREQINQVTSFLDASAVYGSDVETSDAMRTFRNGKLQYGRAQGREPLQPPDPPGGEICRSGAVTGECLLSGDGRLNEQPGLTALHTVWLRYHNKIANVLSQLNRHWSDEKVYQETRRIVSALIQHITYREFLPIVLGEEVVELFELKLQRKGYYEGYDEGVNPAIANAFSTAAFRFGHSLVQNSFVRYDHQHRPLFNNVSLHEEQENVQNIWSFGALDRILIGFSNQPSQRRDEFIADELTNHLFQSRAAPFGMDLAAINIQRGRDHGLPSYTSWRQPCGLSAIKTWADLQRIMSPETVNRFKRFYAHFDDIDLFSGGLAEKPVRGGIIGPTFACIIAQQFLNLRKGDRFWYENGEKDASFTPAQLQQLRHVTLAHILCQTLTEIESIQPFVFLNSDEFRNKRVGCSHSIVNNFDLTPWIENEEYNEIDSKLQFSRRRSERRKKKRKLKATTTTTTRRTTKRPIRHSPIKIHITNVTTNSVKLQNKQTYGTAANNNNNNNVYDIPQRPTFDSYYNTNNRRKPPTTDRNDVTYLFGVVSEQTTPPNPIEVNIKIQYYPPTPTKKPLKISNNSNKKRPLTNFNTNQITRPAVSYDTLTTRRPSQSYYEQSNASPYSDDFTIYRPYQSNKYEEQPVVSSSKRPYIYQANNYIYGSSDVIYNKRRPDSDSTDIDSYYAQIYNNRPSFDEFSSPYKRPGSFATVQKISSDQIHDKLDFQLKNKNKNSEFVKISSVSGQEFVATGATNIHLHISQREGDDLDIIDENENENEKNKKKDKEDVRLVDLHVIPGENRWIVFNATKIDDDDEREDEFEKIVIPDFNRNVSCSEELPRPLNQSTTN